MRQVLIILVTVWTTSCNHDKISFSDVSILTDNQLENNRIEIERIKREIKEFKIDNRIENISLIKKLDDLHLGIKNLNGTIDLVDKNTALNKAIDFIAKNFSDLESFNEIPLQINEETPKALMKLHISSLEGILIRQNRLRYDFPDNGIRFDHVTAQIKTPKTIIKNGEKISGQVILGAESNFEASKKIIRKITLNGQEIQPDSEGWIFQITPVVSGKGLIKFNLNSEIILNDTTIIKGQHHIYVQN